MQEKMVRFVRKSLELAEETAMEIIPFEGRGSDRAYSRVRWDHGSAILVQYQPSRIENTYFADIDAFLSENGIPVPALLGNDPSECLLLVADLGDEDLWTHRAEPWQVRKPLYEKTLRIVHKLHSLAGDRFPAARVKLAEPFSSSLYRWEREYFRENFVETLCGLQLDSALTARLEDELSSLAEKLSSRRQCLVHRDLQSQNVMIHQGGTYLIDFQGMRFGTCFYDLGSILCDPYVRFDTNERMDLLAFYYGLSNQEYSWDEFRNSFWEAAAQRLMQALGAYGFLGIRRGLSSYLRHVHPGFKNLRMAAENALSLPALLEVCMQCEASGIPDSRPYVAEVSTGL
jgi:N-acetylmuramate 1-kinase